MKEFLFGTLLLFSATTMAAINDTIRCTLSAKLGSSTQRFEELPNPIKLRFDVVSTIAGTDILGMEKFKTFKKWSGYSYSQVKEALSSSVHNLVVVKSAKRYTDHSIWINRSGFNHSSHKEYKVKFKTIKKKDIASILQEMGYDGDIYSSADKNLRLKVNTEFFSKPDSKVIKFKEEGLNVQFSLSCLNRVAI